MVADSTYFIHFLAENESTEKGFSYFWSTPISKPDQLMQFIRDHLYGGEAPTSDMYAYDEYMNALAESRQTPFDFEKTLFTMAGELNDAVCQIDMVCTLRDLMTADDAPCRELRKEYSQRDDDSPIPLEDEAFFLLYMIQRLLPTEACGLK